MYNPKVSIITPTYNHERFISQCIESVLNQSFEDWELIIVDDGSTDATAEIVRSFKNTRIKYHRQTNRGIWNLGETYNFALNQALGEFVCILEGDDLWPINKLANQITTFDEPNVVLSWGRGRIINETGKDIGPVNNFKLHSPSFGKESRKTILKNLLFYNFIIPTSSIMLRKEALLLAGGFHQPAYMPFTDFATWLQLWKYGTFHYSNHILGFWRKHKTQTTSTLTNEMMVAEAKYAKEFFCSLPVQQQNDLGPLQKELKAKLHLYEGIADLNHKNYKNALCKFIMCIKIGGLLTKLKGLASIVSAVLHFDIRKLIAFWNAIQQKNNW